MYSRSTQHWGGMAGALLYGIVLGVVIAVIIAALHHRIASRNEFGRAARVCTAAFVALVAIPMAKYPPNPPTVGNPDTVNSRTSAFLLLMGASIVLVFVAFFAWQWFSERGIDGAKRFGAVGGGLAVLVAAFFAIWPPNPDAVNPPDSDAAPALVVADGAPKAVLDQMLATARTNDDGYLRDPGSPDEALDLSKIQDGSALKGTPVAVSTSKLVDHGYTTAVWHFRMLAIAGYALMFAVFATTFGLLADRKAPAEARATVGNGAAGTAGA
ncbi:CbtA family protein [Aquihabitans sp. G128]|uniref:CbtA family protein n=1 Tax=Aquihabitans sp. G128 TaxID=2849779 RepID=UPI001C24E40C|nr:CbtA family protein [Aquihabitans sp. G128]QXC61133.1 CbtA family protein [Aquihabitans sp. G128]